MSLPLEQEFRYYLDHQDEIVAQYDGKVVAIKGRRIIGVFDTELEALQAMSRKHRLGTFLLQRCEPGTRAYTHTFNSRVAIV